MKMIGIVDEFGIENFIPLKGHYREALLFIIRSKLNLQRNAVFFCLDFTDCEVIKIVTLAESHEVKLFNEAGIIIIEKLNSLNEASHIKTNKLLGRFYKLRDRI